MREIIFSVCLLTALTLSGCSESPSYPIDSITKDVQDALPVDNIYVYGLNNSSIHYGDTGTDFEEVYAEDGYLIIRFSGYQRNYYNLSTAKQVEIEPLSDITLRY